MESVIVAIITSIFTLIGVIITSKANANKISKDMEMKLTVHQAVTDEKHLRWVDTLFLYPSFSKLNLASCIDVTHAENFGEKVVNTEFLNLL